MRRSSRPSWLFRNRQNVAGFLTPCADHLRLRLIIGRAPPSCRATVLVCGAHRTSKHGAVIHTAGRRIDECDYAGPAAVHQLPSLSVDRAVLVRAYSASVSGFSSWGHGAVDTATERTFRRGSRRHDMEFAIIAVVLTGSRGVSVCSWSIFPVPPPPTAASVRPPQISSREKRTHRPASVVFARNAVPAPVSRVATRNSVGMPVQPAIVTSPL